MTAIDLAAVLFYRLVIYVPPFLAGMGVIAEGWIIASGVVAYGMSAMEVADRFGVDDYRDLGTDDFATLDGFVDSKKVKYAILMALCYGIGWLFS